MKKKFRDVGFNKKTKVLLNNIIEILEDYQSQGYRLTLRQLYYQLVSRDIIPNSVREYQKLSRVLTNARMGGYVDWDIIEDRLRVPNIPYWYDSPKEVIIDGISTYRLNRMKDQDVYIEVWTEKDALSGILARVTEYYHVRLLVNRGYSSSSSMYKSMSRLRRNSNQDKDWMESKDCWLIYLGDHDPSGLDMDRDIRERFGEFGFNNLNIVRLALTQEQINQYNPPENPTKVSDPRAKWYIQNFGYSSWEVDALEPRVLDRLLKDIIESLIDVEKFEQKLEQEQRDIEKLKRIAETTNWE